MSNWNNERKCETCGKITRKRKHINCPECGGKLTQNIQTKTATNTNSEQYSPVIYAHDIDH